MSIRSISQSNIASKTLRSLPPYSESNFLAFGSGSFSTTVPYAFRWTNSSGIGTQYAAPAQSVGGTFLEGCAVNPTSAAIAYSISGGTEGVVVFRFNATTGWGTKHTIPSGVVRGEPKFSSDNRVICFGASSTDMAVYSWNNTTGIGTKFTNPSSLSTNNIVTGIQINTQLGILLGGLGNINPFIQAWSFNTTTGFGAKFANPTTLPTWFAYPMFSGILQTGNAIIGADPINNPRIHAYAVTASGFGTKYANPTTAISQGTVEAIGLNPLGTAVSVTGDSSPFCSVYTWTDSSGFGTRYANPSTLPGTNYETAWSNDGAAVYFGRNQSNMGLYAFNTATGFGAKYANPSASGFTTTVGACWSQNY